ncbi:MAG TPA: hypothetical protein DIV57_08680 [Stenotrophomonas sp.]|uniref:hypothetical protein n=1 Tax=Stenotrophomonas sp. SPM TaxID=2170735 RepID=UPI000DE733E2|nr:hypothetical protein [Stenotrophomonas sp. SPM]PWB29076.1 hypothetical protein DCO49_03605 [Stenotrophomonas sp. SPM]HCR33433.1 hypothetical protein [Stenotrophomonas sp.]
MNLQAQGSLHRPTEQTLAHVAQFQHHIFEDDEPYARRLQLLAVKQCSSGWDCYASIWTVDANRKAAEAGIRLIMGTVTFED